MIRFDLITSPIETLQWSTFLSRLNSIHLRVIHIDLLNITRYHGLRDMVLEISRRPC